MRKIKKIFIFTIVSISSIYSAGRITNPAPLTAADIKSASARQQEEEKSLDYFELKVRNHENAIRDILNNLKTYAALIKEYSKIKGMQKTVGRLLALSTQQFRQLEQHKAELAEEYRILNEISRIQGTQKKSTPPGGAPIG